jgi:hypothetical protein
MLESPSLTLEVGDRVWVHSLGRSQFSFGLPGVANVRSELKWNHLHSNVFEFHGEAVWRDRVIFNATGGFGYIGGGTLRDQDFDGPNRTALFSDTASAADSDGLSYINLDLGYRVARWGSGEKPRNTFDVLIGYQRWKERYVATKTVDNFPGTDTFDQGLAVTEEFSYSSLRVGARAEVGLWKDVTLKAKAMAIPWTSFELKDIHHQRTTDLLQDPSFLARTSRPFWDGGWGAQLEGGISYRIWRTLNVDLGYQYWTIRSGGGTITSRFLTGDVDLPFNSARTTRQGVTIGLNYTF